MATFQSDKVTTGVMRREPSSAGVTAVHADLTITAAATNDVFEMVKIPKGAVVNEVILRSSDIDTGATLTMAVGDGGDTDRYILASTVGQAGGIARLSNEAGLGYAYTADDTIDILVTAGATAINGGSPTVSLCVLYSREQ